MTNARFLRKDSELQAVITAAMCCLTPVICCPAVKNRERESSSM